MAISRRCEEMSHDKTRRKLTLATRRERHAFSWIRSFSCGRSSFFRLYAALHCHELTLTGMMQLRWLVNWTLTPSMQSGLLPIAVSGCAISTSRLQVDLA